MNSTSKYSPLLGVGVVYVWLIALLFWLPWWQSTDTMRQILGFAGAALVALSCTASLICANRLEHMVKQLTSQQNELRAIEQDYQARNAATVGEVARLRQLLEAQGSRSRSG